MADKKILKVTAQTLKITENTTLRPEARYGAWMAVNQGTSVATVMGYELQPGEGLNFFDAVPAGASWDTAIQIMPGAGGLVVITRLQYKEEKVK